MSSFAWAGLVALAIGCSGSAATSSTGSHPTVRIISPEDGAWFNVGDPVTFEAAANYEDGTEATIEDATWTAGSWTGKGVTVTTDALPAGVLDVKLEATVDGRTLTDGIQISVFATGGDDTGDTGTANQGMTFAGSFDSTITYDGSYGHYEDDCNGSVTFGISDDGTLDGAGSCSAFGYDFDFTVQGSVSGSDVRGDLTMQYNGQDLPPTPFRGQRSSPSHAEATFDKTHDVGGGDTVRGQGRFQADAADG